MVKSGLAMNARGGEVSKALGMLGAGRPVETIPFARAVVIDMMRRTELPALVSDEDHGRFDEWASQ